jgi:predicted RNase H-like nuclease (RuvC/YqgF family)
MADARPSRPMLSIERRSGLPDRRWRPGIDSDLDRLQRDLMSRDLQIAALRKRLRQKEQAVALLKKNLDQLRRQLREGRTAKVKQS